jgi:hypothetical protein
MNRREMLSMMLGAAGTAYTGSLILPQTGFASEIFSPTTFKAPYFGWVPDEKAKEEFIERNDKPFLKDHGDDIKGLGAGKVALLYKFFEYVTQAPLVPHYQTAPDCVSHSFGLGVDVLTAVQMAWQNKRERWVAKCATEIIYGGARIEVAEGVAGNDGGARGVWAAEFVRDWGVLLRKAYLNGKFDYTTYSGEVANQLGRAGVPDELEPLCRLHPVKTCSIVTSWEECRDAVSTGCPVVMCSNIGFNKERDEDGFLREGWENWWHAMLIIAVDDRYKRPGALVQNSWGPRWVTGPTRHGQPAGSFWVDADVIDKAMRQRDSIALSGYVGYPKVKLPDYRIF